jgi:hypothetical protein
MADSQLAEGIDLTGEVAAGSVAAGRGRAICVRRQRPEVPDRVAVDEPDRL